MKYIVTKSQVWTQDFEIEAESDDEAVRLVNNGEGEPLSEEFAYSHDLDYETRVKAAPDDRFGLVAARQKINQETKYIADIVGDKVIVDYDIIRSKKIQPSIVRAEIESIIGICNYDIQTNGNFIEIRLK